MLWCGYLWDYLGLLYCNMSESEIVNVPNNLDPKLLNKLVLSGVSGENRNVGSKCQINANNDLEAIQTWLAEYKNSASTYRAYQKEAERLLLWCVYQKNKPLSSLDRDDFEDYFQFLTNPVPHDVWCAKVKGRLSKRGGKFWRPFTGPLSNSSKNTAITIINSLISYLVAARYLEFNPLTLIRKKTSKFNNELQKLKIHERILDVEEWHAMLDTLKHYKEDSHKDYFDKQRLTYIVSILFLTGLRVNELVSHSWDAFKRIQGVWWLYVQGKGDKLGKIPVNDELLQATKKYREVLGLPPYPHSSEINLPIIASYKVQHKPLTTRYVAMMLKNLAINTALKHFADDEERVEKLAKFSPHWLRHLSATMQDRAGISFKSIKANHRHESDDTTRIYVHAIDTERHEEMNKLSMYNK